MAAQNDQAKKVQFDPTVSAGALLQIATMLISVGMAYGMLKGDQQTMRTEAITLKERVAEDKAAVKETLTDLRTDMKQMQATLGEMKVSLSTIQAVQQQRAIKETVK